MALCLMYVTNDPVIAEIAQNNGVDRVFVDLETMNKEERQHNMNTVKSRHSLEDISKVRKILSSSQLLVRVNPMYDGSKKEIDEAIERGADVIMLPMFRTVEDIERLVDYVNGRAVVMPLLETADAQRDVKKILNVPGIDEIHIGLNDLHIENHKKFLFELLADGTVDSLCAEFKKKGIPYGFGGVARLNVGTLPAKYIIEEHYRLGSTRAILSRSFCNTSLIDDTKEIEKAFETGMKEIREYEKIVVGESQEHYMENKSKVCSIVEEIVKEISAK